MGRLSYRTSTRVTFEADAALDTPVRSEIGAVNGRTAQATGPHRDCAVAQGNTDVSDARPAHTRVSGAGTKSGVEVGGSYGAALLKRLVFLAVLASQVGSTRGACTTVALDKFIGASVPVSAYWSGENCLSGYQPAPLGREGASMVAIDDGGAVLFGGKGTTAQSSVVVYFNDVHVLDIKSGAWIRLPTTGSVPPGSAYHSAVGWSNAANGAVTHMTIFGGDYDGNVKKFNADVYTLELRTGVWTKMKTTGAAPDGRNAHTAVSWTPAASSFAWKMTIFGGELPSVSTGVATAAHPVFAGTATTLDLTTGVWTAVTTTGASPKERRGHSAVGWTDPTSSAPKMTIFGGETSQTSNFESLDDAFTLDLSTNEWTAVSTTGGASPSARSDHSAVGWVETSSSHGSSSVAYEPKLAIFGGQHFLNDVDVDVDIHIQPRHRRVEHD